MEGKGVFMIQAAGGNSPQTNQEQDTLSVREKAKLIENRIQNDNPSSGTDPAKPRGKVVYQWPPSKPSEQEGEKVHVCEYDLSVKEVQGNFVSEPGQETVRVNKQTNVSGRAAAVIWPPPAAAPPSAQVANCGQTSSSQSTPTVPDENDVRIEPRVEEKPQVISVKEIIKRLQSESEAESQIIGPSGIKVSSKGNQSSCTKAYPIQNTDLYVQDMEQDAINPNMPSNTEIAIERTEVDGKFLSRSETSSGEPLGDDEELAGDLELTWQNEKVLENSLRQAVTQMFYPPGVPSLYQQDDLSLVDRKEGNPAGEGPTSHDLQGSLIGYHSKDGVFDARQRAWEESAESYSKNGGTSAASKQEEVFISVEESVTADCNVNFTLPTSPRLQGDSEEMATHSECLFANETIKCDGRDGVQSCDKNVVSIDELNKVLADLDSVLSAELSRCLTDEDSALCKTDQLYKIITESFVKRHQLMVAHSNQMQGESSLQYTDYEKEVSDLNKHLAESLLEQRTVKEEEIRAIVASHQQHHRDIFSKFFPKASDTVTVNVNRNEQSHHTDESNVDGQCISGLAQPEAEVPFASYTPGSDPSEKDVTVDVLSQLAEDTSAISAEIEKSPIWIPKSKGSPCDIETECLSPLSTSTTTFRLREAPSDNVPTQSKSDTAGNKGQVTSPSTELAEEDDLVFHTARTSLERSTNNITMNSASAFTNKPSSCSEAMVPGSNTIAKDDAVQDSKLHTDDDSAQRAQYANDDPAQRAQYADNDPAQRAQYTDDDHAQKAQYTDDDPAETVQYDTFVMNSAVVNSHTFSKVQIEKDDESADSETASCSGEEDWQNELLSDADDDDDIRRLQQRYGEILTWSDSERLSGVSDDDVGSEEESEEADEDEEQNLQHSLKMSLTKDIKEKLSTLTEEDFASMMSEYRDVLKHVEKNNFASIKGDFHTARSKFESDSVSDQEDEDQGECLQTVMFSPKQDAEIDNNLDDDSGLDETIRDEISACCDMATGMDGTLVDPVQTLKNIKLMCDASTSMGVDTLRTCLGMDGSTKASTTESATSPEVKITLNQTYVLHGTAGTQTEKATDDLQTREVAIGVDSSTTGKEIEAEFQTISQELEASDRDILNTLEQSAEEGDMVHWRDILTDHIEKSENIRMRRQAQAYREVTKSNMGQSTSIESSNISTRMGTSSTESQTPNVQMAVIGIQVEDDMLRLKDDLLTRIRSKDQELLDQEEMMKLLSEFRENQRMLVERRLGEKVRANQKLQERLAMKREKRKARQRAAEEPGLAETVRAMDDAFYNDLCERQRTQSITDDELRDLVCNHVDKVETFRRKLQDEVAQKRHEAIQRRMADSENNIENRELNVDMANEIVQKEKENASMVKNVRERERARFDEKLKAKLAQRKQKQKNNQDSAEINND